MSHTRLFLFLTNEIMGKIKNFLCFGNFRGSKNITQSKYYHTDLILWINWIKDLTQKFVIKIKIIIGQHENIDCCQCEAGQLWSHKEYLLVEASGTSAAAQSGYLSFLFCFFSLSLTWFLYINLILLVMNEVSRSYMKDFWRKIIFLSGLLLLASCAGLRPSRT